MNKKEKKRLFDLGLVDSSGRCAACICGYKHYGCNLDVQKARKDERRKFALFMKQGIGKILDKIDFNKKTGNIEIEMIEGEPTYVLTDEFKQELKLKKEGESGKKAARSEGHNSMLVQPSGETSRDVTLPNCQRNRGSKKGQLDAGSSPAAANSHVPVITAIYPCTTEGLKQLKEDQKKKEVGKHG